jgi:hypothetical protein
VIDNVVWTDSWLSNAGAGCGLTRVGAGEEQARKVVASKASSVEKTSRLRSSDPVASCDNPPRKIPYNRLNQSTLVIKQQ